MEGQKFYFFICFLITFNVTISQWITNHNPLPQMNLPKPELNIPFNDPVFNTSLTRISDARLLSLPGVCPDYSKRQAWNADESCLLLRTSYGNALLCDGNNYHLVRQLDQVYGDDVFWHPTNRDIILFNPDNTLYSYNIKTELLDTLHQFTDYTFAYTRGEGNLSRDGKYYGIVGIYYDTLTGNNHYRSILLYDLQQDKIVSKLSLPDTLVDFDWASVSPLGNFVVVDYATPVAKRFNGIEVYDRNMNFLWQQPLGFGHSDLTVDENNDECLIMDYYDENENKTIIKKIRLSDGFTTNLLDVSWSFDLHISCRNTFDNQWCIISTFDGEGRLEDNSTDWLPFEDEIFALKLDGSGDVRRLAHHHSRRFSPATPDRDNSNYYAEPHATVSKGGNRIIFGSNWRQDVGIDSSVDAYVVDLRSLINVEGKNNNENSFQLYQNFPNPFNALTNIEFNLPSTLNENFVRMKVYNIIGEEVITILNKNLTGGKHRIQFNASDLSGGVYFYKLQSGDFIQHKKMILLR